MTIDDVCEWLKNDLHLPQYSQPFKLMSVDGSLLSELNTDLLESELSVKSKLHQIKILKAIKALFE
jgi:hypothetical protein